MQLSPVDYTLYFVYILLREIFSILQYVIFKFQTIVCKTAPEHKALVGKKILRHKLSIYDTTDSKDFLWIYTGIESAENIMNHPQWCLYAIDSSNAWFVKLPKILDKYSIQYHTFLLEAHYKEASHVARIQIEDFCAANKMRKERRQADVIFIAHTPRSGSTLLSQMLQAADTEGILVISEPMVFTNLAVLRNNNVWTDKQFLSVLTTTINSFRDAASTKNKLVIKLDSQGAAVSPDIRRVLPECKILFTHRRDTRRIIQSNHRMLQSLSFDHRIRRLFYRFPRLCTTLFPVYTCYDSYQLSLPFRIDTDMEFAALYALKPFHDYRKSKEVFEDICPIHYEDIVKNPEEILRKIAEVLHLRKVDMEKALSTIKRDSQENSNIGTWGKQEEKEAVKNYEEIEDKIQRLLEYMQNDV